MRLLILAFLMLFSNITQATPPHELSEKNTVFLIGDINQKMIVKAQQEITRLAPGFVRGESIKLFVNTNGGELNSTISMSNFMANFTNQSGILIDVYTNLASSGGFIILQSATGKRRITENGVLFHHPVQTTFPIGSQQSPTYLIKNGNKNNATQAEFLKNVSTKYKIPFSKLWDLFGVASTHLPAEEAKSLNLVDEIVEMSCSPELKAKKSFTREPIKKIGNGVLFKISVGDFCPLF